ncbi:MAG: 6,7-dimethyl-8-ribityllumazine synthase [Candidatus Lokiarchaeota archaeon]|nr:6,7-dimethyl-8-ribityllumazine synthase [Candidatus Lokiarchaeota archaeon]
MSEKKINIGIVVGEFHYDITENMMKKAIEHAEFLGCNVLDIVKVPGSFDMPLAIKRLLSKSEIEGVVCIGAVITGDTDHDQIVAQHAARKMVDLSLEFDKPVSLGVSGPGMTRMEAIERIEDFARRSVESVVKMIRRLAKII